VSIYKIRARRDLAATWTSKNPVLGLGEIGFETDTRKLKIGDGSSSWTVLDYVAYDVGAHNQDISTVNGLQAALNAKANSSHTHSISDVSNLQNTINNLSPLVHSHYISDVTNLQASLDNKSDVGHVHSISDVSALQIALDSKADVAHTHAYTHIGAPGIDRSVLYNFSGGIDSSSGFLYDYNTSHLIVSGIIEASGSVVAPHFQGGLLGAVQCPVKNTSGGAIGKGVPVYITGTVGATTTLEIAIARADDPTKMPALGLLEAELSANATGHATILGTLSNLDTSVFSVGNTVYVGPTGGLVNTRPTGVSILVQNIGRVGRVNSNNGEIIVTGPGRTNDVPNNITLDSLSDVTSSGAASGQVLLYNGSYWSYGNVSSSGPGGSDTQVQFNDGGNLGGDSGLTYNKTTDSLTITGDLAVNGGDITTTSATGSLYNNTATTINIGTQAAITTNIGKNESGSSVSLFGGNIQFLKVDTGSAVHSYIFDGSSDGMWIQSNALGGPIEIGDPEGFSNTTRIIVTPDFDAIQFYFAGGAYTFPNADGSNGQVLTTDGAGLLSWATASVGTKTYSVFTPLDNQPPASNYATVDTRNSIMVLEFDAATDESAVFVGVIPEAASLGSGLKVRIHWMADTATSGTCRWGVQIERMNTDEDSDSFDTATTAGSTTNGTSGIITTTEITITTIDSVAAGEPFRLKVYRDADGTSGTDDMTGDAQLVAVEVRSAS
jgi:hypothetical protein